VLNARARKQSHVKGNVIKIKKVFRESWLITPAHCSLAGQVRGSFTRKDSTSGKIESMYLSFSFNLQSN
jgi:hypothetical protein